MNAKSLGSCYEVTLLELNLILIVTGIVAGIVSTAAGLASLVSYPVLLALGLPPVTANVTNTLGLLFTSVGAVASSQKELKGHGKSLGLMLPLTLLGSIVGAFLLFLIPEATFAKIVPFFIFVAAILIFFPHRTRLSGQEVKVPSMGKKLLTWLAIFLIGSYTGYFGAAGGVLMLSLLAWTSNVSFPEYNAQKNLALGLANVVAAVIYVTKTPIPWNHVIFLGIGFLIGGFLGPRIVRHLPAQLLKILIGIGALILAGSLFVQAYHL
ncbi:sulfite exporter TauE/SafE family protein [Companilactobacillus sp. FL22-1]|uniref:sulfite exporter TauE/SafE family protein n=1 Tax=Companilactobacillus sp. FL22-1 TaxID=3373892 RepID=UPI003754F82D